MMQDEPLLSVSFHALVQQHKAQMQEQSDLRDRQLTAVLEQSASVEPVKQRIIVAKLDMRTFTGNSPEMYTTGSILSREYWKKTRVES